MDYKDLDVQDQIGEGSFGRVYLAKWRETTVAVKVLAGAAPSPDDGEEELAQHRRLLQSLEKVHSCHPFFLCVIDQLPYVSSFRCWSRWL